MSAWLKRFGLHMAAAIGATGIFVAAAAVGANQTRQQSAALSPVEVLSATPTPRVRRRPTVEVVATPTPGAVAAPPAPTQATPPIAIPAAPADTSPDDADTAPDPADSAPAVVKPQPGAQPPASVPASGAPNPPATKPNPARRTPTPVPAPAVERVAPERSLAGTITDILPDGLDVLGAGGREWHVVPAAGALIRLNGKAARLDALHVGDTVVILGQAEAKEGPVFRFLSHAITARRK